MEYSEGDSLESTDTPATPAVEPPKAPAEKITEQPDQPATDQQPSTSEQTAPTQDDPPTIIADIDDPENRMPNQELVNRLFGGPTAQGSSTDPITGQTGNTFVKPKKSVSFKALERLTVRKYAKPGTSTENRFAPLTTADAIKGKVKESEANSKSDNPRASTSNDSPDEETESTAQTSRRESPPPIILNYVFARHQQVEDKLREHLKLGYKVRYAKKSTVIYPKDMVEYRKFKQYLLDNEEEFYTYGTDQDKRHAYILRGLDAGFTEDEIKKDLADEHEVIVETIYQLKKTLRPLFMLIVSPNITLEWLTANVRYILHTRVYWERRKNDRQLPQCHRCQVWGHSARNCFKPYVCLKCGEAHETYKCEKARTAPAKCANCSQAHPANDIECPVYLARLTGRRRPSRNDQQRPPPRYEAAPPPRTNAWENRRTGQPAAAPRAAAPRQQPTANADNHGSRASPADLNSVFAELGTLNSLINLGEALRAVRDLNKILQNAKTKQDKFYAFLDFAANSVNNYDV